MQYAYRDRRAKKENLDHYGFKELTQGKSRGLTYAKFINGLQ